MRGFGFIALLLVAALAGAIGYNVGLGANVAANGGATVVYTGWGFGFPIFGLLFGILFIALIFGLVSRAARGGHRGYGPGSSWGHRAAWDGRNVPPMAEEMLQHWHRQAHGEPGPTTEAGPNDATSSPTGEGFGRDR